MATLTTSTELDGDHSQPSARLRTAARRLQQSMWAIGGFDRAVLDSAACRSVRPKYSCMGAMVLLTAGLAACSATFALFTIFKRLDVSVALGTVWSLMILTIDRFLVSSTRKL